MSRIGAIDIGSNSVLLLAAERVNGRIETIDDLTTTTRLAGSAGRGGELSEPAMERTILALRKYRKVLKLRRIEECHCFATAALRKAPNRESFKARVYEETGFELKILSAREEALLTFLGALGTEPELGCPMVVADIGGGSTEVVYGVRSDVSFWKSFSIGAHTVARQFDFGSPLTPAERRQVEEHLFNEFRRIPAYLSSSFFLACGGTATTLAAISLGLTHYDFRRIDGHLLSAHQIQRLYEQLNALTVEQRLRLAGLDPERADIIVPAMLILLSLMKHMAIFRIKVSTRGARHGMLISHLQEIDIEEIT